jgi:hypothetical protein
VELDAARAAEAAAKAQLETQRTGTCGRLPSPVAKSPPTSAAVCHYCRQSPIHLWYISPAEYERRESEARFQLNELTRGIAFYRRLGLDFEKINDDRLRLVFTQVDPADPEAKFCFSVRVTDADAYEVEECAPPVRELPELLRALNESNDFSRFVQAMRAAFKRVALGEGGSAGRWPRSGGGGGGRAQLEQAGGRRTVERSLCVCGGVCVWCGSRRDSGVVLAFLPHIVPWFLLSLLYLVLLLS